MDPGRMPTRAPGALPGRTHQGDSLADILERVLDKGIVIAGDIEIHLLDIELLTVKLRLLVASADKAKEMGIDWWEGDPFLSRKRGDRALEERLRRLEAAAGLERGTPAAARAHFGLHLGQLGVDVVVRRLDAVAAALPRADLALANIALGAVEELGERLDAAHVVTSGYLTSDATSLRGFRRVERRQLDGWAADVHARL